MPPQQPPPKTRVTISQDTITIARNIPDRGHTFDRRRDHMLVDNTFSFSAALTKLHIRIIQGEPTLPRLISLVKISLILFQHRVSFDGEEEEHTTDG
ncbi:hypothetical protein M9H77_31431 [Catharanthus roseus]|uniref:Uncharacterized protein n=1 Tax=Catharanthus roseus TaxID=4058 RepID=A0ACC0A0X9_CATRO|nr:hypothetical protein M9H77_31431 [Catharanthus roseus]